MYHEGLLVEAESIFLDVLASEDISSPNEKPNDDCPFLAMQILGLIHRDNFDFHIAESWLL